MLFQGMSNAGLSMFGQKRKDKIDKLDHELGGSENGSISGAD